MNSLLPTVQDMAREDATVTPLVTPTETPPVNLTDAFEHFRNKLTAYLQPDEVARVEDAYLFGDTANRGQVRSSGAPYISHPLAVADTLADWRSQRRGPAYFAVGRKIWYPRDRVENWLQTKLKETEEDGNTQTRRNLALQVQSGRPRIQRDHKLGRHHTKREQSEAA